MACHNKVHVRTTPDNKPIYVRCGKWYNGERRYCDPCEENDVSFPNVQDYIRVADLPLYPMFQ